MPRKTLAKSKRPEAERASEHYLVHVCGCDPEQIRRAIRTKWQSVDFWACDVMGRTKDGMVYFAQVTAGKTEAVRVRRRKLEKISWNIYDNVMVLQLVEQQDPANMRRKQFFFRVHHYDHIGGTWFVDETANLVPREWFKKFQVSDVFILAGEI